MGEKKASNCKKQRSKQKSLEVVHEGSPSNVKHDQSDAFFIALNEVVEETSLAINRGWRATKKFLLETPVDESDGDIDSIAVVLKNDGSKDAWFLYDFEGCGPVSTDSASIDTRTRGTWNSLGESRESCSERADGSESCTDESRSVEGVEEVEEKHTKRGKGENQEGKSDESPHTSETKQGENEGRDELSHTTDRQNCRKSYSDRFAREDKLRNQREKERAAKKEFLAKKKRRANEQKLEKAGNQDRKSEDEKETKKENDGKPPKILETKMRKERQGGLWDNFISESRAESHRSAATSVATGSETEKTKLQSRATIKPKKNGKLAK